LAISFVVKFLFAREESFDLVSPYRKEGKGLEDKMIIVRFPSSAPTIPFLPERSKRVVPQHGWEPNSLIVYLCRVVKDTAPGLRQGVLVVAPVGTISLSVTGVEMPNVAFFNRKDREKPLALECGALEMLRHCQEGLAARHNRKGWPSIDVVMGVLPSDVEGAILYSTVDVPVQSIGGTMHAFVRESGISHTEATIRFPQATKIALVVEREGKKEVIAESDDLDGLNPSHGFYPEAHEDPKIDRRNLFRLWDALRTLIA